MAKHAAFVAIGYAGVTALAFSPTSPATAIDCRAAPGDDTPPGQHWYYRLDHATRRQCWYLRSASPVRSTAPSKPARAARPAAKKPARVAAPLSKSSKEALFQEFLEWQKNQPKP
jgi:hypothetical protein